MLWEKDPDATLQYIFDWAPFENGRSADSNWLDRTSSPKEEISSATITADSPGPAIVSWSVTDNNTSVTFKVSGGVAGNKYKIMCEIVTSTGQTDQRTAILEVINK